METFSILDGANVWSIGLKINIDESTNIEGVVEQMWDFIGYCCEKHDTYRPAIKMKDAMGKMPKKTYDAISDVVRPASGEKYETLFRVCGRHTDTKTPHLHFHAIVKNVMFPKTFKRGNQSRDWEKKTGNKFPEDVKFQVKEMKAEQTQKWNFLSYPLKEGDPIQYSTWVNIGDEEYTFLVAFGTAEYDVAKAKRGYVEKAKIKQQTQLNNLLDLCKNNRSKFCDIYSLIDWYDEYLEKELDEDVIDINDLPNSTKIYYELEKCAKCMKIWKLKDGYKR